MIANLNVYNLPIKSMDASHCESKCFYMATCQRILLISFGPTTMPTQITYQHYLADEAYGFLLETITGLQSKILGECEIVGQFRQALDTYLLDSKRDPHIVLLIQKLLQDGKKIRSEHLCGIGQQSYAGITRKILSTRAQGKEILLLGSGNLAHHILKILQKKFTITISARNNSMAQHLSQSFNIKSISWQQNGQYLHFANIVCTIGTYTTLLNDSFFISWKKNHPEGVFIDLGSPSTIKTSLDVSNKVYRLFDIYNECNILNYEKDLKLLKAREAIKEIIQHRSIYFSIQEKQLSQGACFVS